MMEHVDRVIKCGCQPSHHGMVGVRCVCLFAGSPSLSLSRWNERTVQLWAAAQRMKKQAAASASAAATTPKKVDVPQPAGVLLDIGISSPQLDDGQRGFRPEMDGPLDLRFDTTNGQSAWDYLATCTREHFESILVEYVICLLYTSPSPRDRG